jgi:hypothetical protein
MTGVDIYQRRIRRYSERAKEVSSLAPSVGILFPNCWSQIPLHGYPASFVKQMAQSGLPSVKQRQHGTLEDDM